MPREYTIEEVRALFLQHATSMVEYWDKQNMGSREKLEGLTHSLFVALDGGSSGLPGFTVTPSPHPTDKEYFQEKGENWFPDSGDIAGSLHEEWGRVRRG